jgi:hypothetical protein
MCSVQLPPGVNPIAVKYIMSCVFLIIIIIIIIIMVGSVVFNIVKEAQGK